MHKALKDQHDLNETLITLGVGGTISFIVVSIVATLLLGPFAILVALGHIGGWVFVAWMILRDPEAELKKEALLYGHLGSGSQSEV